MEIKKMINELKIVNVLELVKEKDIKCRPIEELASVIKADNGELSFVELAIVRQEIVDKLNVQRTASHDTKKMSEIMQSAMSGADCGIVTFGEVDGDKIYIVDGNSRSTDCITYISLLASTWDNASKEAMEALASNSISFRLIKGNQDEINTAFLNLNSSVALSNAQKNKGKLGSSIDVINELALNPFWSNVFSARKVQKEEQIDCIIRSVLTAHDLLNGRKSKDDFLYYASSTVKCIENLSTLTIDTDRYLEVLDLLGSYEIDFENKARTTTIIGFIYYMIYEEKYSNIFSNDELIESLVEKLSLVPVETSGTNSSVKQEERIKSMIKKVTEFRKAKGLIENAKTLAK